MAGNNVVSKMPETLRCWLSALTENLFFLPLGCLLFAYLVPDHYSPLAVWLLPVVSLAGAVGCALGLKVRWKQALAALLLGLLYAALLAASGGNLILHAVVGSLLAMQSITAQGRPNRLKLYWIGIGIYFLAGAAFPRFPDLSPFLPVITGTGVVSLAAALFLTNRLSLKYNSLDQNPKSNTLPKGVRRYNGLWVAAIIAAALLLALGAGRWAGNALLGLLRMIVQWLLRPSDEPPKDLEPPSSESPPAEMELPEGSGPPAWLSQILDIAYNVIAGAMLLAVIALIGYGIYKYAGPALSRWLHRLLGFLLRRDNESVQQEYQDEEVRLTVRGKTGGPRGTWLGKWAARIFKQGEAWEKLQDNRERVRFLYRRQLQQDEALGMKQRPYLTPREQELELQRQVSSSGRKGRSSAVQRTERGAIEPLLALYYRARYGEQQPEDEEVKRVKDSLHL